MSNTGTGYDCTTCGACCCNIDKNRAIGFVDYVEVEKRDVIRKNPALMKRLVVVNDEGMPHMKLDARQRIPDATDEHRGRDDERDARREQDERGLCRWKRGHARMDRERIGMEAVRRRNDAREFERPRQDHGQESDECDDATHRTI